MKKILWTLNIGGDYAPEITSITYPLLRLYARKIGADFRVISERRFHEWPIEVEKLQIYDLGRDADWNLFLDSDALIHPEMFDPTAYMPMDTVAHYGSDWATNRWNYNDFLLRDGRHISSCNWFTVASKLCLDLWHPPDWTTPEETAANIFPVVTEINAKCFQAGHLSDDYLLSVNIARYGLKFTTIDGIRNEKFKLCPYGSKPKDDCKIGGPWVWHAYTLSRPEKVRQMEEVLRAWQIESFVAHLQKREASYALDQKAGQIPFVERESTELQPA